MGGTPLLTAVPNHRCRARSQVSMRLRVSRLNRAISSSVNNSSDLIYRSCCTAVDRRGSIHIRQNPLAKPLKGNLLKLAKNFIIRPAKAW